MKLKIIILYTYNWLSLLNFFIIRTYDYIIILFFIQQLISGLLRKAPCRAATGFPAPGSGPSSCAMRPDRCASARPALPRTFSRRVSARPASAPARRGVAGRGHGPAATRGRAWRKSPSHRVFGALRAGLRLSRAGAPAARPRRPSPRPARSWCAGPSRWAA